MEICDGHLSVFFPIGHGLLVPWRLWNLPRLPGSPRTMRNRTERIEKQLLVGLTYADMSKISMKSSDMDDLSRCRDTNCRTGNAMICADVCSPLKVHSKSVAKRFFPNDSPGVKSWGQEPSGRLLLYLLRSLLLGFPHSSRCSLRSRLSVRTHSISSF